MKSRLYNEMNDIYVEVDWNNNTVAILRSDTMEPLEWLRGWNKEDGRIYPAVRIPKTGKLMLIHRLVAYTYLIDQFNERIRLNKEKGISYERLVVDHIDNNPMNPMPSNLRWCNQSENLRYRKKQKPYNKK